VAIPLAAIPILGNLFSKVLDKVSKDKIDDATRAELKMQATKVFSDEGQEDVQQFFDFILDYEGRAEDHGAFIKWLRGAIRPVLTLAYGGYFLYIIHAWLMGWTMVDTENAALALKLVFAINLLIFTFWFGERAVKNVGLQSLLKSFFQKKE
jgi:hypothetical protein